MLNKKCLKTGIELIRDWDKRGNRLLTCRKRGRRIRQKRFGSMIFASFGGSPDLSLFSIFSRLKDLLRFPPEERPILERSKGKDKSNGFNKSSQTKSKRHIRGKNYEI